MLKAILSEHLDLVLNDEVMKPWNRAKAAADIIGNAFEKHGKKYPVFDGYKERLDSCAQQLSFIMAPDDAGVVKAFFAGAEFCRIRFCPVCQFRRSVKWKARFWQQMPEIEKRFPNYRWLFLTVTVKNCHVRELRDTVAHLSMSFQRLTRLRAFPAAGWVRSIEVTRAKNGMAHPHVHALLLVPPGYFGGTGYMKHEVWRDMWQESARLDYEPVIDIRAVRYDKERPESLGEAVAEIVKYSVKESDMTGNPEWAIDVAKELLGTRAISVGGKLRKLVNKGKEKQDLKPEDTEHTAKGPVLFLERDKRKKKYELFNAIE